MNSRILLKSQRNEILALIKDHDLDPALFSWVEVPSELNSDFIISRLLYKDSNFFYSFEMEGEVHSAIFSPSEQSYVGSDYPGTWEKQKKSFSKWLYYLKKEEDEPDLWSAISPKGKPKEPAYVVTGPSEKSPDTQEMDNRLNELLKQQFHPGTKRPTTPIRRYYGKA